MNTGHKEVIYRRCSICGTVYGVAGQSVFMLSKPVQATQKDGRDAIGICPRHKGGYGDM